MNDLSYFHTCFSVSQKRVYSFVYVLCLMVCVVNGWSCADEETQAPTMQSISGFGEDLPDSCIIGEVDYIPATSASHIDELPISYEIEPPSSGDHRSQWAKWGAYETLPAERWLHNLEHGGIVVLYQPGLIEEDYQAILQFLQNYPADEGGTLRWILTPYESLTTPVALITWQWRMFLSCWHEQDIQSFIQRTYRRAPEDIAADGSYEEGWLSL